MSKYLYFDKKITGILLSILFLPLLCISCHKNKYAALEVRNDGEVNLYLHFKDLNEPLKVSGREGLFFFETAKGKVWIKGRPEKVKSTKYSYDAEWTADNRDVQLSLKAENDSYTFSIKALPDDDILKWGIHWICREKT